MNGYSGMVGIAAFAVVSVASAIIGASVLWGARHGTLRESDQERYDRRFNDIVTAEGYSPSPRPGRR